ncbi:phosphatase PAP2 family protein [Brachybacterium huguangmaarense]|uniref:Phosphatase PAP2 family protein n=1 Tax=Brachybacterium huguangmaarense TaxID=1652028 RepID=A0ABY6FZK5_9MICO|nr:phosphatase PAP2 family protein [Brachybacterium huguangmaarense]UYG15859.1 phosphatase PAP2 family protein [Brachybacterium huguangmaarense]
MQTPPTSETMRRAIRRCLRGTVLALLVVAVLGRVIPAVPWIEHLDLRLVAAANRALGPFTSELALRIDTVFGPPMAAAVALLVVLVCVVLGGGAWAGLRAGLLIAVPWGLVAVLKLMVQRPRPEPGLLVHQLVPIPSSFSFPSGHTAFAAAICCAVLLTLRPGAARRLGTVPAVIVVAVTAWSRVALGVHHPTDVLASAVLVPFVCVLLSGPLDLVLPVRHDGAGGDRLRNREEVARHG